VLIYLAVGSFGFFGAVLRFAISRWVGVASFPYGTLVVNILGSLLIGYLVMVFQSSSGWGAQIPDWAKTGITVGFLGALTTFSTFSLETIRLMGAGMVGFSLLNVLANNLICLSFCYVGWKIGQI
jgi:CrcB protein